jgi:hypothetical protein
VLFLDDELISQTTISVLGRNLHKFPSLQAVRQSYPFFPSNLATRTVARVDQDNNAVAGVANAHRNTVAPYPPISTEVSQFVQAVGSFVADCEKRNGHRPVNGTLNVYDLINVGFRFEQMFEKECAALISDTKKVVMLK